MQSLLPDWRLHCAMVLKSLLKAQSSSKFAKTREFITRLAQELLLRKTDVVGYLTLSLLTDSFDFNML